MGKTLSESQIDDVIKLKWGSSVDNASASTYTSNRALAKAFKVSADHIRKSYMRRFRQIQQDKLPLIERLRLPPPHSERKHFGIKFLKKHEIGWLTSNQTLKLQTALSLTARVEHFKREFPMARMNVTLLRKIYCLHKIKQKKICWFKLPKEQSPAEAR